MDGTKASKHYCSLTVKLRNRAVDPAGQCNIKYTYKRAKSLLVPIFFITLNILTFTNQIYILRNTSHASNMQFQSLLITLLASGAVINAAVVDFFSDTNCATAAGSRNIYDSTCASTGGFQSFRITTSGGTGQTLTAWSENTCGLSAKVSVSAAKTGNCVVAHSATGGSNAISSH
jgi:hypothetical protein